MMAYANTLHVSAWQWR